jgi:hypothetical protein
MRFDALREGPESGATQASPMRKLGRFISEAFVPGQVIKVGSPVASFSQE